MLFKVIIAGSRSFNDYPLLMEYADKKLARVRQSSKIIVISGGARGADKLGEQYAIERGYSIMRFLPDWDTHGNRAGIVRNREMARHADALLAYWDGRSLGTLNMINEARARRLLIGIKRY